MVPESLTPGNSTVILVDHAVGFANVLRSHHLADHINNVVALAKTATCYGTGLVVTNGPQDKPSGPLYPQLLEVIGDHPIIGRSTYNAFLDEDFAAAVRATGRDNIVVAGVSTEGCVLQTVLGGLRQGYKVHLVVNASAAITSEAHVVAVQRMIQAGVVPLTWTALGAEFQVDQRLPNAGIWLGLLREHIPELSNALEYHTAAQAQALAAVG